MQLELVSAFPVELPAGATAEISRSQIWQWIRSPKGVLDDGCKVTVELFCQLLADEMPGIRAYLGGDAWAAGKYAEAAEMFDEMCTGDYVEFLTLPAYDWITRDLAVGNTAIAA